MDINLATRFLFRSTTKGNLVSSYLLLFPAAQVRLVKHLNAVSIYDGETAHGFQGSTAVLLSLLGASKDDIVKYVIWCSARMVEHYAKMLIKSMLCLSGLRPLSLLQIVLQFRQAAILMPNGHRASALSSKFQSLNTLVGVSPFFLYPRFGLDLGCWKLVSGWFFKLDLVWGIS